MGVRFGTNTWLATQPLSVGEWHCVRVHVRDGEPYLMADVYVDGLAQVISKALPFATWSNGSIALLSPTSYSGASTNAYCEWDNFRVTDEQYSFVYTNVVGLYMPTSNVTMFYPYVPDYDPEMWEYEASSLGGQYEWYAYFRGQSERSAMDVAVYFSPRLMVEDTNFPTVMNAGDTVLVPVEWEHLPFTPVMLNLELADPYSGAVACRSNYLLTTESGTAYFPITVSTQALSSPNYLWAAYVYATNASDPFGERIGLDDTFRFDTLGQPIGPETPLTVVWQETDQDFLTLYSDAGLVPGATVWTWAGGGYVFDGNYPDPTAPEGSNTF